MNVDGFNPLASNVIGIVGIRTQKRQPYRPAEVDRMFFQIEKIEGFCKKNVVDPPVVWIWGVQKLFLRQRYIPEYKVASCKKWERTSRPWKYYHGLATVSVQGRDMSYQRLILVAESCLRESEVDSVEESGETSGGGQLGGRSTLRCLPLRE
jgi:hypothetical protein